MENKFYRHGDILLRAVKLEDGMVEGIMMKTVGAMDNYVVAEGETTGHKHLAVAEKGTQLGILQDAQGRYYMNVPKSATVTHEEHKAITLDPGIYRIEKEREFDYFAEETRRVIDPRLIFSTNPIIESSVNDPPSLIVDASIIDRNSMTFSNQEPIHVNMSSIQKAIKELKKAQAAQDEVLKKRDTVMRHSHKVIEEGFYEYIHNSVRLESWPSFGSRDPDSMNFTARLREPNGRNISVSHNIAVSPLGLPTEEGSVRYSPRLGPFEGQLTMIGKLMAEKVLSYGQVWRDIAEGRYNTVKSIMGLTDIEHRMAALKVFGVEKFISEGGGIFLDESEKGNQLYAFLGMFSRVAFFLKYQCPSTGRIYVSGVDPNLFSGIDIHKTKNEDQPGLQILPRGFGVDMARDGLGSTITTFTSSTSSGQFRNSGGAGGGGMTGWMPTVWPEHFRGVVTDDLKVAVSEGKFKGMADRAMSWKFGITLEEYLGQIKQEA